MIKYSSVTIPMDLLRTVDEKIKGKGYASRAEFVKQAIRHELKRKGLV